MILGMWPNFMIPHLENASLDGRARVSVRNWEGEWRKRAVARSGRGVTRWIRLWPARVCGLIRTGTRVARGQGVGCLHPGGRMSTALDGTKGGFQSSLAKTGSEQATQRKQLKNLL